VFEATSYYRNVFTFTLFLSAGRAGEAWEPSNKIMLFLPLWKIKCLSPLTLISSLHLLFIYPSSLSLSSASKGQKQTEQRQEQEVCPSLTSSSGSAFVSCWDHLCSRKFLARNTTLQATRAILFHIRTTRGILKKKVQIMCFSAQKKMITVKYTLCNVRATRETSTYKSNNNWKWVYTRQTQYVVSRTHTTGYQP
jgi:hypothetical protein